MLENPAGEPVARFRNISGGEAALARINTSDGPNGMLTQAGSLQ